MDPLPAETWGRLTKKQSSGTLLTEVSDPARGRAPSRPRSRMAEWLSGSAQLVHGFVGPPATEPLKVS